MAVFSDTTLTDTIELDGNTFTNVKFVNAELHYAGGAPPRFQNVDFTQTRFVFDGPAQNTVQFLRTMTTEASKLSPVVLGLLPELRR